MADRSGALFAIGVLAALSAAGAVRTGSAAARPARRPKGVPASLFRAVATLVKAGELEQARELCASLGVPLQLPGLRKKGLRLSRLGAPGINLSGARIPEALLTGCDLPGADLRDADISRSELSSIDLQGALAAGVDLSGSKMEGVSLKGADLTGANLSRLATGYVDLRNCNLRGADLTNATLGRGTNISGASFDGAVVAGLVIDSGVPGSGKMAKSGALVSGARLAPGTVIADRRTGHFSLEDLEGEGVRFSDVYMPVVSLRRVRFPSAELIRFKLSHGIWDGLALPGSRFDDVNIGPGRMLGCDMSRSRGTKLKVWHAEVIETSFDGAEISGATFIKVEMNSSNLSRSRLLGVEIRDGTTIRNCDLRNATISGVLRDSSFQGCDLRGADISGLKVPGRESAFSQIRWDARTRWPPGLTPPR